MAIRAIPSMRYELINGCVRRYPSGREVCCDNRKGKHEYRNRLKTMAERQHNRCSRCDEAFTITRPATFGHDEPRRMGGGFRDDRIEIDGVPVNHAEHESCNNLKGSRR